MRVKRKMKRYSKFNSMEMFIQMTADPTMKIQTCMVVFTSHQGLQFSQRNNELCQETCTKADLNQIPNQRYFAQKRIPSRTDSPLYTPTGIITCICMIQPIPGVNVCRHVVIYCCAARRVVFHHSQNDFQQLYREWV